MKLAKQPEYKKSWFQAAGMVVIAMVTSIVVTACGNKDGGGGAAPVPVPVNPVPITPTCTACGANMTFLSSGVGRVYSVDQIELALEFFGDAATVASTSTANQPAMSYYGQFAAQGYIFIGGNMLSCGIPAMGLVAVRTLQPGIWGQDGAGRSVRGLYLETVGAVPVQLYLDGWIESAVPAIQARDGRTFPFKVKGLLQMKRSDSYAYCNVTLE